MNELSQEGQGVGRRVLRTGSIGRRTLGGGRLWLVVLGLALLALSGLAEAHSTVGRVKVSLDWDRPTTDDFAYFIEPYVNDEKYEGQHKPHRGRFYVTEITEVMPAQDGVTVHFEVLDMRGNRRFDDAMRFERTADGDWQYRDAQGVVHPVFTYIPQWLHITRTYLQPAALVAVPVLLLLLVWLRMRSKRHKAPSAEPA